MDERSTDAMGWSFNLAIFRIVFLAYAVLPFAQEVREWTSHVMPALQRSMWLPTSFYQYIPFSILTNAGFAHMLAVTNVVLIIFAVAGVFTRYTLGLATVLSVYLFGLVENQGKVDHFHHLVWFMALLAVGPSGRLLSIDAIVSAIRGADRGTVAPRVPGFAALWTLRYTWALFGLLYVVPGLAKFWSVFHSHWATAENVRHLIWAKWFELSLYEPGFVLPLRVDHLPSWVLVAFAWGAIAFELGFVTLVLLRPTRGLAALCCIAFLELNQFVLHIFFGSLAIALVCLFDWSAIGRSYAKLRGRKPLLVVYDGGCGLCRRTIAVLGTMDIWRALEPVAGLSADSRRRRYAELTDEMLMRDMYVVKEGTYLRGYDAYVAIAERIPILWPFSFVMKVPPVGSIGRVLYRRVADGRVCSTAPHHVATSPTEHPRVLWIHVVGVFLIVAQTFFSVASFASNLHLSFLPKPVRVPVKALQQKYAAMRLNWPFDAYPAFDNAYAGSSDVWEARLVLADGSERRVSPAAYATFCNSAQCMAITRSVLAEKNLTRQRDMSLDLTRQLWRYEANRNGSDVVGMRIYHARYSLDPSMTRPLAERRMYEFLMELISSGRAK